MKVREGTALRLAQDVVAWEGVLEHIDAALRAEYRLSNRVGWYQGNGGMAGVQESLAAAQEGANAAHRARAAELRAAVAEENAADLAGEMLAKVRTGEGVP